MIINEQPYGTLHLDVETVTPVADLLPTDRSVESYLRVRAERGWVELSGIITKGSTTSRLFHATSTRDRAGERITVQVPRESYQAGSHTFVAG